MSNPHRESMVYAVDRTPDEYLPSVCVAPAADQGAHSIVRLTVVDSGCSVDIAVSAEQLVEAIGEATGLDVGPYWDQRDCAEFMGLEYGTFRSYRAQRASWADFPEPVRRLGKAPLWRPADVRAYRNKYNNRLTDHPKV